MKKHVPLFPSTLFCVKWWHWDFLYFYTQYTVLFSYIDRGGLNETINSHTFYKSDLLLCLIWKKIALEKLGFSPRISPKYRHITVTKGSGIWGNSLFQPTYRTEAILPWTKIKDKNTYKLSGGREYFHAIFWEIILKWYPVAFSWLFSDFPVQLTTLEFSDGPPSKH